MAYFDSFKIYALLNGTWTDLTSDTLVTQGASARWGIFSSSPTSVIADVGEFRFSLRNSTGKYIPELGLLPGWDTGIKIKAVFIYKGVPYVRFLGYIAKDGLRFVLGKTSSQHYVEVTVLDWMKFATDTPILSPTIEENKTADEAIELLLDRIPFDVSTDLDTGDFTFQTVFDGTTQYTTAYSEFSRLAYSESPGRIYLLKQRDSGQLLRFENSTARDAPVQKTVETLTPNFWKSHGGHWLNHSGGKFMNHSPSGSGEAAVTFDSNIDELGFGYGNNVFNHITVTAYPKRTDTDLQVLYRLPNPITLDAGETKTITGRYIDPSGGGVNINAIVSSMQTPAVPGGPDPTLKCLINFSDEVFLDETGRHTITMIGIGRYNDLYDNGYYTVLTGGVMGPYTVYGGYSDYRLTMPASDDFDLFNGTPCTIGFFAAIFNINSGQALITRDNTTTYPPYLLGYATGDGGDIQIFMSSNGSSWNVANGKSWGIAALNKWTYYELNYDGGWFYAFADGKLTDKWYNATPLPANSNPITMGQTQTSVWQWFAQDMFFIHKGRCLHKTDFEVPRREMSATLDGDYLLNTAKDGSGTDLSSDLSVGATYSPDEVSYTLKNNSASNGYVTHLQARGRGLYNYDRITKTIEDAASITANGYQSLNINQYYQQDLTAGSAWITDIIANINIGWTAVNSLSFFANKTDANMNRFLQCDVGDLIYIITTEPPGDAYYHIQSVNFDVLPGNIVKVTWGLVNGVAPA